MAVKRKPVRKRQKEPLRDPGKTGVKIIALSALIVTAMLYFGIVILFSFTQEHYIFSPSAVVSDTPRLIGLNYEAISLTTDDGVTLDSWYVPAEGASQVILFCHGNAGNLSNRLDNLKLLHDLGYNVFIFDYRGFGKSTGNITEKGTYYDAAMAWQFLRLTKKFKPSDIVIFGRSLGGTVAAWLASQQKPGGLIIESAFVSIQALGSHLYPFLPVTWLTRFNYNTMQYLQGVTCPVLVIHSTEDEMIPFEQGEELFKSIKGKSTFLKISGSHTMGFKTSGERYINGIRNFLNTYVPPEIKPSNP